jgi:hypothetical protein
MALENRFMARVFRELTETFGLCTVCDQILSEFLLATKLVRPSRCDICDIARLSGSLASALQEEPE